MPLERIQIIDLLKTIHPFRRLNPVQLEMLADHVQQSTLPQGEIIYRQNALADKYYIIVSGQVNLTRLKSPKEEITFTLNNGDTFGFEAQQLGHKRLTTARSVSETVVLWLDYHRLKVLLYRMRVLRVPLKQLLDSHKLAVHHKLSWLAPREQVYYVIHRHPFFLWRKIAWPILSGLVVIPFLTYLYFYFNQLNSLLILVLLASLLLVGWFFWESIDWGNDYYIITNRRVVNRERVILLYDSRQEVPLEAILSISTLTDNWIQRRFRYGTILVRTFTGTLKLDRMPYPENFTSLLEELWTRSKISRAKADKQAMQENIRRKLGFTSSSPPTPPVQPELPKIVKPGWFQNFFSRYFQLRLEKSGAITYRTHWFILFKKVFLPSLFIMLLLGLVTWRFFANIMLLPPLIELGVVLFALFVLCFWWWYHYSDWSHDIYVVTDKEVIDARKKPFAQETRQAAPLKNIQSVEYQRIGIPALILNFGTVFIRVGDTQLKFLNVHNPTEVQREIALRLNESLQRDRQAQVDSEHNWVADYIESYHRVLEQERKK